MVKRFKKQASIPRVVRIESLEPRVLYSAESAPLLALVDPEQNTSTLDISANGSDFNGLVSDIAITYLNDSIEITSTEVTEVVLVDSSHADIRELLALLESQQSANDHIAIVTMDSNANAMDSITQILSRFDNLNAVHIVSHASDGALLIGEEAITEKTLQDNEKKVAQWGKAIAVDGDILLYGCNLSATDAGQGFAKSLADLSGADVASSSDATGHALRHGDWDLEIVEGVVDTDVAFNAATQANWQGSLDIVTGLVHHYQLDANGLDSVGAADAVMLNSVSYDLGEKGYSAAFEPDGSGTLAMAEVPAGLITDFGTGNFSVSLWAKTLDGDSYNSLVTNSDINSAGFRISMADGLVKFEIFDGATSTSVISTERIDWDSWTHIVAQRNGDTLSLHLLESGGFLIETITGGLNASSINVNSTDSLRLGAAGSSLWDYDGQLDDIRLYSKELDTIAIDELNSVNLGPYEQHLVTNTGVTLDDQTSTVITTAMLNTIDPDTGPVQIIYNITANNPDVKFTLNGSVMNFGNNFSQNDLEQGKVGLIANVGPQFPEVPSIDVGLSVSIHDGDGQGTNTDAVVMVTVVYPGVNSAPTTGNTTLDVVEDDSAPAGDTVQNIFGPVFTDTASDSLSGILVSGVPNNPAQGEWEYSSDGIAWHPMGTVNATNALALSSSTLVRFIPAPNYSGLSSILVYHALDTTYTDSFSSGASKVQLPVTPNGGTTPISSNAGKFQANVLPVNDSPQAVDYVIPSIDEDIPDLQGSTIQSMLGASFSDPDVSDNLAGIIIVENAASAEGAWEYSADGTTWLAVDSVSATNGLVLNKAAYIRFYPATDYNGTPPDLIFNVLDSSYTGPYSVASIRVPMDTTTFSTGGAMSQNSAYMRITVVPNNDAPIVANDSSTVTEGDQVIYDVLNNDLDVDGDNLTVTISSAPTNGAVIVLPDQRIEYTHDGSETTSDTFKYTVNDGTVNSLDATVTLTITPVNDSPSIADATLNSVAEDTVNPPGEKFQALYASGFLDPDSGDIFSGVVIASDFSKPAEGHWEYSTNGVDWANVGAVHPTQGLALSATTNIRFLPAADFHGAPGALTLYALDSSYTGSYSGIGIASRELFDTSVVVTGSPLSASSVLLETQVTGVNDPPFAVNDNFNATEGVTLTDNVSLNDGDVDSPILTVSLVKDALNGTLTLNGDGSFTYDHDGGSATTDSFRYQISDGTVATTADVSITIATTNDDPVLSGVTVISSTSEQAGLTIAGTFNVSDPEGDAVTLSLVGADAGLFSINPSNQLILLQPVDHETNPSLDFSIVANDGNGGVATSTHSIAVTNVNEAPTIASASLAGVAEGTTNPPGTTVSNLFLSSFSDPDANANFVGIAVTGNTIYSAGDWQYSTDGISWQDIGGVSLNSSVVLAENHLIRYLPSPTFNGIPPPLEVKALDQGYTGAFSTNASMVTINGYGNGTFDYISENSVEIQTAISAVNNRPDMVQVLLHNGTEDIYEPPGLTFFAGFDASFTDIDAGDTFAGVVIIDNASTAAQGQFQYSMNGTDWVAIGSVSTANALVLESGTAVRFVPAANFNGSSAALEFYAFDSSWTGGYSDNLTRNEIDVTTIGPDSALSNDTASLIVTIAAVDDPPIAVVDNFTATEGVTLIENVTANDSELDGEPLTATLVNDVQVGALTFNPDGSFNYIYAAGNDTSDSFTYTLTDGNTTSAVTTVDIAITPVNEPPSISVTPLSSIPEDTQPGATVGVVSFNDPENDSVTISIDFPVSSILGVSNNTNIVLMMPLNAEITPVVPAVVRATDVHGLSSTYAVNFPVGNVNEAPTIATASLAGVPEDTFNPPGATISSLFLSTFSDPDAMSAFTGVAITSNTVGAGGEWEYSNDGLVWQPIGAVSTSSALVLAQTDHVRFVPAANFNGTPFPLLLRGLDDGYTGGFTTPGSPVFENATGVGQFGYISQTDVQLQTTINSVNDRPSVANAMLPSVTEDEFDSLGEVIFDIYSGSFLDDDIGDQLAGVAIVGNAASAAQGTWEYSLDRTNWLSVGPVSSTQSLMLAKSAFLRFVPAPDFNGTPGALSLHAVDDSTNNAFTFTPTRIEIDTSSLAAHPTLSLDAKTLDVAVSAINDAPVFDSVNIAPSVGEDASVGTVVGTIVVSDEENHAVTLSIDPLLNPLFTINGLNQIVVAMPLNHESSSNETFDIVATDELGLSTTYTASILIADVNDAPVITSASLAGVAEGTLEPGGDYVYSIFIGAFFDVDAGDSLQGVAITGNTLSADGEWQYSTDGRTTWHSIGAVSPNNALTLDVLDFIRFLPAINFSGPVLPLDVRALDNDYTGSFSSGATASYIDASNASPYGPISVTDGQLYTAIGATNDRPQISGTTLTDVDEDSVPAGESLLSLFNPLFNDADVGDTLAGLVITGDTSTLAQGEWQYSVDGTNWLSVGAVSETQGLVLDTSTKVRFLPAANYAGLPGYLSVYALDSTWASGYSSSSNRVEFDASVASPFSALSVTSARLDIEVLAINDPPIVTADSFVVVEGGTATGNVLANDTDVDDTLTIVSHTTPANGTLTLLPDGSGSYVHDGGVSVTDSFSYTVTDGTNPAQVVPVAIAIQPINDAPVISVTNELSYIDESTLAGTPVFSLATTDEEGELVTLSLDSMGATFFELSPSNQLLLLTQPDFETIQSIDFVVTATDATGASSSQSISIPVADVNEAPIIASASLQGIAEDSVNPTGETVAALFASSLLDVDANASLAGIAVTGHTLSSDGVWEFSNDGISWQSIGAVSPNSALILAHTDSIRFAPATNFNGTPTPLDVRGIDNGFTGAFSTTTAPVLFDVSGTTQFGAISLTDVKLHTGVTAVNDVPIAQDENFSVAEGADVVVDILRNDSDIEDDPLAWNIVDVPLNGTLSIQNGTDLLYTHDGGASTTDLFTYTVSDGLGNSTIATATITVTPANDAPVFESVFIQPSISEQAATGTIIGSFVVSDEENDQINLSIGPPFETQFTVNSSNEIVLLGGLDHETQPVIELEIRATDIHGGSTIHSQTIVVDNANEAPMIASASLAGIAEDTIDPAGATVDSLFFNTLVDEDAGARLSGVAISQNTMNGDGEWQYSTDGVAWYSIGTVSPSNALVVQDSDFIRYLPSAQYSGSPAPLRLHALDDGYAGSYSNTLPIHIDVTGAGIFGAISVDDVALQTGVHPVNDAPYELLPLSPLTVSEAATNSSVVGTVQGADLDSTALTYDLVNSAGGRFSIDPVTGVVSVADQSMFDFETTSVHPITVRVTDDGPLAFDAVMNVTITDANEAPSLQLANVVLPAVNEGDTTSAGYEINSVFQPIFTDPDNLQSLGGVVVLANDSSAAVGQWQYQSGGTSWVDMGNASTANALVLGKQDKIRFVPAPAYSGPAATLTIRALDSAYDGGVPVSAHLEIGLFDPVLGTPTTTHMSVDDTTITTAVVPVNDAPDSISVLQPLNIDENAAVGSIVGTAVATDPDDTTLAYSLVDNAAGRFTIDSATGAITVLSTTGLNFETDAAHQLGVMAQDAAGLSIEQTFTVSVNDIDEAPIFLTSVTMAAVDEDNLAPNGASVMGLFQSVFDDPDTAHSFAGVAIVQNTIESTVGQWQYQDSTGGWQDVGVVSQSNALVLNATENLRFVPAANYNGSVAPLQVHAIDSSYSGGVGFGAHSSSTLFTVDATSVSVNSIALNTSVTPVNDAPSDLVPLGPLEIYENEFGYISTFVGTDIDSADLTISLASNDPRFSIDANNQLLLNPGHALDFEQGANPQVSVDVTDSDGLTISKDFVITVLDVNERPQISAASLIDIDEDTLNPVGQSIASLLAQNFIDPEVGDSLYGIAIVENVSAVDGVWQYQVPGGAWQDIGSVSNSNALVLSADNELRFLPATNFNGTPANLFVHALDSQYSGDVTTSVSKAYLNSVDLQTQPSVSVQSVDISVNVNPINDAPQLQLTSIVTSISEHADTTVAIDLADIIISDNDGGNNTLSLSGAHENEFQISATGDRLQLKPGATLDFEALNQLDVGVVVQDANLPASSQVEVPFSISITDANEAPSISNVEIHDLIYIENSNAVTLTESTVVNDLDAATISSAQISFLSGYHAGEDRLLYSGLNDITAEFDSVSGVMTLTGAASAQAYQDAIRSVTYLNLSDDPATQVRVIEISVADSGLVSNTLVRNIAVQAVNDEQGMLVNTGVQMNFGSTLVLSTDMLSANDLDHTANELVFSKSSPWASMEMLVSGVATDSFTQADLVAGLVELRAIGAAQGMQALPLLVDDGEGEVTSLTFNTMVNVIPEPEPEPEPEPVLGALTPAPIATIPDTLLSQVPTVSIANLVSFEPEQNAQDEENVEAVGSATNEAVAGMPANSDSDSTEATSSTSESRAASASVPIPVFPVSLAKMSFVDIVKEISAPEQVLKNKVLLSKIDLAELQLASLLSLEPITIDEVDVYESPEHNAGLLSSIEKMQKDLAKASQTLENSASVRDTIVGFSLSVTAGFLVWMLRGGALLASMFSISPLWKQLDPLPIVNANGELVDKGDEDDTLEELFVSRQ